MIEEEKLSIQMLRQRLPTTWSLYLFLVENQNIFSSPLPLGRIGEKGQNGRSNSH